jgi:hypothetical protein
MWLDAALEVVARGEQRVAATDSQAGEEGIDRADLSTH